MSVRLRSFLAAILGAGGLFLILVAALFPGLSWLFWVGIVLAAAGVVLLGSAMRQTVREIGSNQAKYEAELRAQLGERKKEEGR